MRRRETLAEVGEQRGKVGIGQIVVPCVKEVGGHQALGEHIVESEVGVKRVTGLGQIDFRGHQDRSSGQWESLVTRSENQGCCEVPSCRSSPDDDLVRPVVTEECPVGGHAVIERRRVRVIGWHSVVHGPGADPTESDCMEPHDPATLTSSRDERPTMDFEQYSTVVARKIMGRDHEHPDSVQVDLLDVGGEPERLDLPPSGRSAHHFRPPCCAKPRCRRALGMGSRQRAPLRRWPGLVGSGTRVLGCHEREDAPSQPALAVDVPGISAPQNGCEDTAVNPFLPACIIHEQLFASSCPKSVAKSRV